MADIKTYRYPGPPISHRQIRFRRYVTVIVLIFIVVHFTYLRPTDFLSASFVKHQAYMNDGGSVHGFEAKDSYDWQYAPFRNTPSSYLPLPTEHPKSLPQIQFDFDRETASQRKLRETRRVAIREEFQRSWRGYKSAAWLQDELKPVSFKGQETYGGWAATLVDSLDTLWIMGLKKDFYEAVR